MSNVIKAIRVAVDTIKPFDSLEATHKQDILKWLHSGLPIFRISKPGNPPKHLVCYFVLFDQTNRSLMLIKHIKSGLLLPAGGHVDIDENPHDTVVREAYEELKIDASFETELGSNPFFITATKTNDQKPHTDVSLWYIINGNARTKLDFDTREMTGYQWFTIDEVLATEITELDPHMHRFAKKLNQYLET